MAVTPCSLSTRARTVLLKFAHASGAFDDRLFSILNANGGFSVALAPPSSVRTLATLRCLVSSEIETPCGLLVEVDELAIVESGKLLSERAG